MTFVRLVGSSILRWTMLLCLFCVMLSIAGAQPQLIIDTLDAGNFPEIRAKIRALYSGNPVAGLTIANFSITEDGRPQAPLAGYCVDTARENVSVLLVIDKSTSMGPWPSGSGAISDEKVAARNFIDLLSAQDEFALLSFHTFITEDQTWTSNKALIKSKIDAITTDENTALWDAVVHGAGMMGSAAKRRVMIVMTDGYDNRSTYTAQQARAAVLGANTTAYVIGLGRLIDENDLKLLASTTGGKYYNTPSSSELNQIYNEIGRQLIPTGICELRYNSLLDCLDGSVHTVTITVTIGSEKASASKTFKLPYDSTTFSYVHLTMDRDYVVKSGDTIQVPLVLTRVSVSRPSSRFTFQMAYNRALLDIDTMFTTSLSQGYSINRTPTASGASVTISGPAPIVTPGEVVRIVFRAVVTDNSRKAEVTVSPPDAGTSCTMSSSDNGLITISGRCDRVIVPVRDTAQHKKSELGSVTPNPLTSGAWIDYSLMAEGRVRLEVYDVLGRRVMAYSQDALTAGEHRHWFDAGRLSPGWYLVRLHAPDAISQRRILLLR